MRNEKVYFNSFNYNWELVLQELAKKVIAKGGTVKDPLYNGTMENRSIDEKIKEFPEYILELENLKAGDKQRLYTGWCGWQIQFELNGFEYNFYGNNTLLFKERYSKYPKEYKGIRYANKVESDYLKQTSYSDIESVLCTQECIELQAQAILEWLESKGETKNENS